MPDVLFTAADIAEMRAFNDANLPDTVALRHGTRTYEAGGTRGPIVWDGGDPMWTEPARVSPASAPQEQLTGGSVQDARELIAIMRDGVSIPRDDGDDFYRLEWTHTITGLASPFMLYDLRAVEVRTFRMMAKYLGSVVAPQ